METSMQQDIQIHYGPVRRSRYLENFIKTGAARVLGLSNDQTRRIRVWLSKESGFTNRGVPQFLVKVGFKSGGRPMRIVEAQEPTLISSINSAFKKAFKNFSERKNRRLHGKRHL